MKDWRGIQRLGVHLVAVVVQSNDDGVWVEYDLHILHLPNVAIWSLDGERNEVVPIISFESHRHCVGPCVVTPLVQGVAQGSGHVRGFIRIIRIFDIVNEWVLSWVNVLAHVTSGVAPRATCCRCTAWCSASHAAIFTLLFAMAFVNSSSLHIEHTFWIALCSGAVPGFFEWDQQQDLSLMAIFRSPNVGINLLRFALMGRGGSHSVRV